MQTTGNELCNAISEMAKDEKLHISICMWKQNIEKSFLDVNAKGIYSEEVKKTRKTTE